MPLIKIDLLIDKFERKTFEFRSWRGVLDTPLCDMSLFFLRVLRFPLAITLSLLYNEQYYANAKANAINIPSTEISCDL